MGLKFLKEQAKERARLVARLGWLPEVPTAAERYAATTGELWQWVAEAFGVDEANRIRDLRS